MKYVPSLPGLGWVLVFVFFGLGLAGCQARAIQVDLPPTAATTPIPILQPTATDPLLLPLTPPPATAPPAQIPSQDRPIFGLEGIPAEGHPAHTLAYQAGIAWVRRNALKWSEIEPSQGQRLWNSALESEMMAAAKNGAEFILIVRDTPSWAQKVAGISCGPVVETQFEAFARFLQDAVVRYSQPPYNVKNWEIWNEPDVVVNDLGFPFGCWGDPEDPTYGGEYYGRMLKVVYPAIKAADPGAQVLIGGLLLDCNPGFPDVCKNPQPMRFLEGVLMGSGGLFDGVSFHAYDYYFGALGQYGSPGWNSQWNTTGPVLTMKSDFIRSILNNYGLSDKYLINTEVGLINTTGLPCDATCEETKAIYVGQAYTTALAANLRANIWYNLLGWRDSGLLGPKPDFTPLPAYHAYRFASSQLSGAAFVRQLDLYPGVKVYELARAGVSLWVAWSIDGADHAVVLPGAPRNVWDLFGNPMAVAENQLLINVRPVYIEWIP